VILKQSFFDRKVHDAAPTQLRAGETGRIVWLHKGTNLKIFGSFGAFQAWPSIAQAESVHFFKNVIGSDTQCRYKKVRFPGAPQDIAELDCRGNFDMFSASQ
jgi:hypothetical protein